MHISVRSRTMTDRSQHLQLLPRNIWSRNRSPGYKNEEGKWMWELIKMAVATWRETELKTGVDIDSTRHVFVFQSACKVGIRKESSAKLTKSRWEEAKCFQTLYTHLFQRFSQSLLIQPTTNAKGFLNRRDNNYSKKNQKIHQKMLIIHNFIQDPQDNDAQLPFDHIHSTNISRIFFITVNLEILVS